MGLGLIAAGLFNIFVLQSEGLRLIMSIITIPIFILTAWETREIKREAQKAAGYCDPQAANRSPNRSRWDVPEHPEHVPGIARPAVLGLQRVGGK